MPRTNRNEKKLCCTGTKKNGQPCSRTGYPIRKDTDGTLTYECPTHRTGEVEERKVQTCIGKTLKGLNCRRQGRIDWVTEVYRCSSHSDWKLPVDKEDSTDSTRSKDVSSSSSGTASFDLSSSSESLVLTKSSHGFFGLSSTQWTDDDDSSIESEEERVEKYMARFSQNQTHLDGATENETKHGSKGKGKGKGRNENDNNTLFLQCVVKMPEGKRCSERGFSDEYFICPDHKANNTKKYARCYGTTKKENRCRRTIELNSDHKNNYKYYCRHHLKE